MLKRRTAIGTACVTTAVALAAGGCSGDPDAGTNGIGLQAPDAIVAKARAAALSASSVRLSGSVVSAGADYHLDMRLQGDAGTGEVSSGNRSFELLRVSGKLYVKGDAAFYAAAGSASPGSFSDPAAADKLQGRYLLVHTSDPSYKQLSAFTDKRALLGSVTDLGGPARKDGYTRISGLRTVGVTADGGSTLRVSLEGAPYPVRVERPGGAGTLDLTDFGADFDVEPPAVDQILDYGMGAPGGNP